MNLIEHYVQATILETIKQPIFIEDIYGVYVYCNQAFADFMEQPIDRIVKRADTKNLQSRLAETASLSKTSDVKISLNKSNDAEKIKLLRPGMNVEVDVHLN